MASTLTVENVARLLNEIGPDDVARVYSGKPGCGCGCRGTYYDHKAMKTKTINAMRGRVGEVVVSDDGNILSLEDKTRYRWLYFTA